MTPEAMKAAAGNGALLRRLAEPAPIKSIEGLAAELGRDPDNLRKTIKTLEGYALVGRGLNERKLDLTDAGKRAIDALAVADGLPLAGLGAAPVAGAWLRCDQIEPDPDNRELAGPGAGIVALAETLKSEGLKQPPHVRAAGANGLHMLVFGERRWRAWSLLVERGDWPADHLEFCPIEAGDELAIVKAAAVENAQRLDLGHYAKARQFKRLADLQLNGVEIGKIWNCTPEHVQQHLRLLDKAPELLKRADLDRDDPDFQSVQKSLAEIATPRAPKAEDAPALLVAMEGRAASSDRLTLSAEAGIALVELSRKMASLGDFVAVEDTLASDKAELIRHGLILTTSYPQRQEYKASVTGPGWDWLGAHPEVVASVPEREAGDQWLTPWLNPTWPFEPVAEPAPPSKRMFQDKLAQQMADVRAEVEAEGADKAVEPWKRAVCLELAYKMAVGRVRTSVGGEPCATVGAYWLDARASALVEGGFVRFVHPPGGAGPVALLGSKGLKAVVEQLGFDRLGLKFAGGAAISAEALRQAQEEGGLSVEEGQTYATPWLANEIEDASDGEADDGEDDDERDGAALAKAEAAADFLGRWAAPAGEACSLMAEALKAAGLVGPFHAAEGEASGAVFDSNGAEAAMVDHDRELSDDLARARAILVAAALNAVVGDAATRGRSEAAAEPAAATV